MHAISNFSQEGDTEQFQDVMVHQGYVVATVPVIVLLSSLFFFIGIVGIVGNFLVIYVVLSDRSMRSSVTNLLITNLAFSDFVIMVVCVPDIVQFMMNSGWRLGLPLCKALRFLQLTALYTSVMTLVSVCIERYVAIVHPMKAHIVCCRARIIGIIAIIWPLAAVVASPNLMYHVISPVAPNFTPCVLHFPHPADHMGFKFAEFVFFYLLPLTLQTALYIRIGQKLFNNDAIKRMEPISGKQSFSNAMRSRKGVVKMLIAGVVVYIVCFSPHQILLFYGTFSGTKFQDTWSVLILVNIMAYASSAANPLLYSVFSHKFRRKLGNTLCCREANAIGTGAGGKNTVAVTTSASSASSVAIYPGRKSIRVKSFRTTVSEV